MDIIGHVLWCWAWIIARHENKWKSISGVGIVRVCCQVHWHFWKWSEKSKRQSPFDAVESFVRHSRQSKSPDLASLQCYLITLLWTVPGNSFSTGPVFCCCLQHLGEGCSGLIIYLTQFQHCCWSIITPAAVQKAQQSYTKFTFTGVKCITFQWIYNSKFPVTWFWGANVIFFLRCNFYKAIWICFA